MTISVVQNLVPNDPDLADLLNLLKKDINLGLSCHHVGTIQSFDATTQRANVTVNYKQTYFETDLQGNYEPKLVDYPIALDCPVIVLGGGTYSLTFPITVGDECLLLFNDRDLDNWLTTSSTTNGVASPRLHSFSDAIALVGLRSILNVVAAYSSSEASLRDVTGLIKVGVDSSTAFLKSGLTQVVAGAAKVNIQNAAFNLNTILQQEITQLQNLTTQLSTLITTIQTITVASVPIDNSAAFVPIGVAVAAIQTALGTVGTSLGSLLE